MIPLILETTSIHLNLSSESCSLNKYLYISEISSIDEILSSFWVSLIHDAVAVFIFEQDIPLFVR